MESNKGMFRGPFGEASGCHYMTATFYLAILLVTFLGWWKRDPKSKVIGDLQLRAKMHTLNHKFSKNHLSPKLGFCPFSTRFHVSLARFRNPKISGKKLFFPNLVTSIPSISGKKSVSSFKKSNTQIEIVMSFFFRKAIDGPMGFS